MSIAQSIPTKRANRNRVSTPEGLAADVVPLALSLYDFYGVVRAEPRIKGIGVDHTAGYIHVNVREAIAPTLRVHSNGRVVVTSDPFLDVVNG